MATFNARQIRTWHKDITEGRALGAVKTGKRKLRERVVPKDQREIRELIARRQQAIADMGIPDRLEADGFVTVYLSNNTEARVVGINTEDYTLVVANRGQTYSPERVRVLDR